MSWDGMLEHGHIGPGWPDMTSECVPTANLYHPPLIDSTTLLGGCHPATSTTGTCREPVHRINGPAHPQTQQRPSTGVAAGARLELGLRCFLLGQLQRQSECALVGKVRGKVDCYVTPDPQLRQPTTRPVTHASID